MERPSRTLSIADDALLSSARAGNDAALEALIKRFEGRVYALARAIVRKPAWAEDVTQDTLLRMLRRLPQYDGGAERFETWLLSIARNTALSLLRRGRVRGELGGPEIDGRDDRAWERQAAAMASPDDRIIALENSAELVKALDHLPAAAREIVMLRFYHDLGPAEIARVVGDSPVNVRVRLFRAVAELRTLLAEKDDAKP